MYLLYIFPLSRAPHTYGFVVLTSLTHPRKIFLVVLQIRKAKYLSAPLRRLIPLFHGSCALLDKPAVAYLLKCPAFYGNESFVIMLTRALSWARLILSTSHIYLRSVLIVSSKLRVDLSGILPKFICTILSSVLLALPISSFTSECNNIWRGIQISDFLRPPIILPPYFQILPSAHCSQTHSVCVPLLTSQTTFYAHTKPEAKNYGLCLLIFTFKDSSEKIKGSELNYP
jgi:hypothetical protein